MNLCIKWLIQAALITGFLCNTAYAATETASTDINIPDVVAAVNGHNITREDLERRMNQSRAMDPARFDAMSLEQRKGAIVRTVNDMVLREVVYQEAVKRKVTVSDREVDLKLEDLQRKFPSEDAFKKAFADARITIVSWKAETRRNLMAMKLENLVAEELKISDSEIAAYYEEHKKDINQGATETLEDHREHVRAILQQTKWQELRSAWLNGLLANAIVQKWTP